MSQLEIGLDIGHGSDTYDEIKNVGGKFVIRDGKEYEEHDFNSAVALLVKEELERHDVKVFMAQKPYAKEVPLSQREKMYDARNVASVWSIHANAGGKDANGTGVFSYQGSEIGRQMAELFMEEYKKVVKGVGVWGKDGLWISVPKTWSDFFILRTTDAPAVLLELGFMTNANDFRYIFGDKKNEYIPQVAQALLHAILRHHKIKYIEHDEAEIEVTPVSNELLTHMIQKGDTFYSIAKQYNVQVFDLQNANKDVKATKLQIGDKLLIPNKKTVLQKPKPVQKPKTKINLPTVVLRKGSRGENVKTLQKYLNHLGYKSGKVDGIFGTLTHNAVVKLQKRNGLKVDGIYGKPTEQMMEKLLNK